jgi:nucleotide-binding universal stress UspA family protein
MTQSLITVEGCVLAAVDASSHASGVAGLSGWAAARLGVDLEFVHAIDRASGAGRSDLSGNLSLGSQEALLAELTALDEQRSRLAQAHGRALLEQLRAEVHADHGVDAHVVQRHGELVETLLDAEPRVRLFVIGSRGEHAGAAREHLGSNLERVIRAVHRPVLVAPPTPRPIHRFLIAFDGSATTRRCVEMVAASPLLRDLECHVVMVGGDDPRHREALQWAGEQLRVAGFSPLSRLVEGSPEAVIAAQMKEHAIDLLVMGAYGHSRIRNLIVGSTTTQLLRAQQGPILLLR